MPRARKQTGLAAVADAVAGDTPQEVQERHQDKFETDQENIDAGDVIQVVNKESKRIAQCAIVYRVEPKGLLCYLPRAATKPETFTVKYSDVVRIGKAKLRYKKQL